MFLKIEKEERFARSAERFFAHFRVPSSIEVPQHGATVVWQSARSVPHVFLKLASSHRCASRKDAAHQPEQPAPMERVLCGVFLGALLVVPAGPVRRSSGEQEQAVGLEMIRQSLHPTCQSRCAQTETERERGRETDRDRETETELSLIHI